MSIKDWVTDVLSIGDPIMSGFAFPKSSDPKDAIGGIGLLAVFAGVVHAFSLNAHAFARLSFFDVTATNLFFALGCLVLFWVASKLFVLKTKSSRILYLNVIENYYVTWILFLAVSTMLFIAFDELLDVITQNIMSSLIGSFVFSFICSVGVSVIARGLRYVDPESFVDTVSISSRLKGWFLFVKILVLTLPIFFFYFLVVNLT